ncbi:MAG: PASTA domain-containing protein, partial [Alphaproteobacteria bacterium]
MLPVASRAQDGGWWPSVQDKIGHVTGNLDSRFTLDGGDGDGGDGDGGADGTGDGTGGAADGPGGDSGAANGGAGAAGGDAQGPSGAAAVNPADPATGALIITWLRSAEPPQNVTEGANFRYSNTAAMIGTAANGGIVTARHDPPVPDPVWLWANRRASDSVNHCTMEEYVVALLNGDAIAGCRGRYQQDTTTASASGASDDGAPSGASDLSVPDLAGLTSRQARDQLESVGLLARVRPGPPGRSADDTGRVARQNPATATVVQPGTRVDV